MTRSSDLRLADINAAIGRCQRYAPELANAAHADMAYDAILRNLAVIGEAVRTVPDDVRAGMPEVPWAAIAGLRNVVVHEYFRVNRTLVLEVVTNQLTELSRAIEHYQRAGH